MPDFLTSIRGRRVGLDVNKNLVVRNPETGAEIVTGPGTDSQAKIRVGGVIALSAALVISSATTAAQTLATYSVPKSTLGETGGRLRFTAWGAVGSNAVNLKSIRVVVGGSTYTTGSSTYSGLNWRIERDIIRTAANAQSILTRGRIASATPIVAATLFGLIEDFGTDTSVDTDTITITVSATEGSGTVTNQISLKGYTVEYFPPALT